MMLQLKGISKMYRTGDLVQIALNQVSVSFRKNEFVSILGPSGSGKTTLLNVIGGLDRYDSGNLIINGKSTNQYKDRDWDTYRNHSIGFVFQSYNLIPHQSLLANVELALTIAGISAKERRERAVKALEKVGLGEQLHKKPNQISGGQMQRVAIARALVNEPEILLADEPTGALDTHTGIQVMELLKEVAKDRLVIMVTHNSELAETYSSRIVHLVDGRIVGDSHPYDPATEESADKKAAEQDNVSTLMEKDAAPVGKNAVASHGKKRASMSFLTALSLSFRNLGTKKGRTILTSLAGSIGIIGIALILGLSTGVNAYVESIQKDTMVSYPITIQTQTIDMNGMLNMETIEAETEDPDREENLLYSNSDDLELENQMQGTIHTNDLVSFKKYLEDSNSEIWDYVGEYGIVYSYHTPFTAYAYDPEGVLVNTDGSTLLADGSEDAYSAYTETYDEAGITLSTTTGTLDSYSSIFEELQSDNQDAVSGIVTDNYEVIYGTLPASYDEVVLIANENGEIPLQQLYAMGYLSSKDYSTLINSVFQQKDYKIPEYHFTYEDLCGQEFYLVPACEQYIKMENGLYQYQEVDADSLPEGSLTLKVTGILQPKEDAGNASITGTVGYTRALTDYLIDYANGSDVVLAQRSEPSTDVRTGQGIDVESYEMNLSLFGYVDREQPASINIYADNFEDKEGIADCIEQYNKEAGEDQQIVYTDMVALLVSSVTSIVNVISWVLIAFVAISLVVAALMIGIITYISVLERTKEIGILRAMGASRSNISQVFIAETFLVGLGAGIVGVGISELLLFLANGIIQLVNSELNIHTGLPIHDALLLVGVSIVLTVLGGLVPAVRAAGKNPVTALRSE